MVPRADWIGVLEGWVAHWLAAWRFCFLIGCHSQPAGGCAGGPGARPHRGGGAERGSAPSAQGALPGAAEGPPGGRGLPPAGQSRAAEAAGPRPLGSGRRGFRGGGAKAGGSGPLVDLFWGPIGGPIWVPFRSHWWPHLGPIGGPIWVSFGSHLGFFWVLFGSLFGSYWWPHLGPFRVPLVALLGSHWWPHLCPFWVPLVALFGFHWWLLWGPICVPFGSHWWPRLGPFRVPLVSPDAVPPPRRGGRCGRNLARPWSSPWPGVTTGWQWR